MLKFLIIPLIFTITACSTNTDKPKPKENKDSVTFVPKYLADPNNTLDAKVKKLELGYIVWGCACANWITPEDYPKGTYETEKQLSKAKVFRYPEIKIVDKHH